MQNNYGTMLRNFRLDLQLSQKDVAKYLGVSLGTIQAWEKGKNVPKRAKRHVTMCSLFNLDTKERLAFDKCYIEHGGEISLSPKNKESTPEETEPNTEPTLETRLRDFQQYVEEDLKVRLDKAEVDITGCIADRMVDVSDYKDSIKLVNTLNKSEFRKINSEFKKLHSDIEALKLTKPGSLPKRTQVFMWLIGITSAVSIILHLI